jgi:hypothetical protein
MGGGDHRVASRGRRLALGPVRPPAVPLVPEGVEVAHDGLDRLVRHGPRGARVEQGAQPEAEREDAPCARVEMLVDVHLLRPQSGICGKPRDAGAGARAVPLGAAGQREDGERRGAGADFLVGRLRPPALGRPALRGFRDRVARALHHRPRSVAPLAARVDREPLQGVHGDHRHRKRQPRVLIVPARIPPAALGPPGPHQPLVREEGRAPELGVLEGGRVAHQAPEGVRRKSGVLALAADRGERRHGPGEVPQAAHDLRIFVRAAAHAEELEHLGRRDDGDGAAADVELVGPPPLLGRPPVGEQLLEPRHALREGAHRALFARGFMTATHYFA